MQPKPIDRQFLIDLINGTLISVNELDTNLEASNIVDALFSISRSIQALADATLKLGTYNASTEMGAIELLAMEVKNGFEYLANNN